jgi:hypothetical protein
MNQVQPFPQACPAKSRCESVMGQAFFYLESDLIRESTIRVPCKQLPGTIIERKHYTVRCDECEGEPDGSPRFDSYADAELWIDGEINGYEMYVGQLFHVTSINHYVWCVACVDLMIEDRKNEKQDAEEAS